MIGPTEMVRFLENHLNEFDFVLRHRLLMFAINNRIDSLREGLTSSDLDRIVCSVYYSEAGVLKGFLEKESLANLEIRIPVAYSVAAFPRTVFENEIVLNTLVILHLVYNPSIQRPETGHWYLVSVKYSDSVDEDVLDDVFDVFFSHVVGIVHSSVEELMAKFL